MSIESVRADISAAVERIRLESAVPTMRNALLCWQDYLAQTKPNGLSADDEKGYRLEFEQIKWLLTEVFPEKGGEQ